MAITKEQRGVGFIVKPEIKNKIKEIRGVTDRIAMIKVELGKSEMTCIQVYAPTAKAEEKEVEDFYEKVRDLLEELKLTKDNIIY